MRTHWHGCWRTHPECAHRVADEALEQLHNAVYWLDVACGEQAEVLERLHDTRRAVKDAVEKMGGNS